MKKLVVLAVAAIGGVWAAGHYLPGFWSKVPTEVHAALPQQVVTVLADYFNYPRGTAAKAPAAGQNAAAGGPGAGGPGAGGPGGRGPGGGAGPTPVTVSRAMRSEMPLMVESIGTVQAISSVVVRSRVDSQVEEVHFSDGASVNKGDLLATLDSRAIRAQIAQAEATLVRDRASLDLARSTLRRGEDLAVQSFATKQRLDENRASVAVQEAQVKATTAQVDLLKTQLTYYSIQSPISGKAGIVTIKPGNMARSSDGAPTLTTINQIAPIYVAFSLPQRYFDELRQAIARKSARVEATPQGGGKPVTGALALVDNVMDSTTGTIGVRAIFGNETEALWPGQIVDLKVTLREEPDQVIVPREAVQMSQKGNFVFIVADGMARMRPVKVGRAVGRHAIITEGLDGTETVIVDGQLLVVDGARVQPRQITSSVSPSADVKQPL